MPERENLEIVRRAWDAWNAHDPDAWIKLLDREHVVESDTIPAPVQGLEAARPYFELYRAAFPDLHFHIDQMIASGDFVVSRYTATGTHQGELGGLPATSRRVKVNVCTVNELRGERIVRSWVYWDSAHLLRQLGALP